MSIKLNLNEKLDFSDIDLTAPDIVINELLVQLPEEPKWLINGKIQEYNGHIISYTKKKLSEILLALGYSGTIDKEVDIQENLGEIGTQTYKLECYLWVR